jgi:hypothetical protein
MEPETNRLIPGLLELGTYPEPKVEGYLLGVAMVDVEYVLVMPESI